MASFFAKPENVLVLAGIALADEVVLVSARQYVPTLYLSKTSFWSGTKINLIRFGSYPNTGLIELARGRSSGPSRDMGHVGLCLRFCIAD